MADQLRIAIIGAGKVSLPPSPDRMLMLYRYGWPCHGAFTRKSWPQERRRV